MRVLALGYRTIPLIFVCLFFCCLCAPVLAQPDPLEFENQIDLLTNERAETRRQAVEKLIELRNPDAIGPLIGMLRDPDESVWQSLTYGLQNFPREMVWKPLLQAMGESEEQYQPRYVAVLRNFGDGNVTPLLHAMANPSPRLRAGVLRAMDTQQYISDKRVRKIVIDALVDADPLLRAAAVPIAVHMSTGNYNGDGRNRYQGMDGPMGGPGGPPPVPQRAMMQAARAIHRGNVIIRPVPGVSPPKPDNSLLNSLILSRAFDLDARVRAAVAANALDLDDTRAEGVVRAACGDVDEKVRAAAYTVLLEHEKINIDQLLVALKDDAPIVRQKALQYTNNFDDPRVKEFIISSATDKDPLVRKESLLHLSALKDPAKVTMLALAALKDESAEVRGVAVQALSDNGDLKKWLPELEPLLKDEKLEVKRMAAKALVAAHDRAHSEQYFAMLDDPDLAGEIIPIIGSLRDKRAVPRLIAMLKEIKQDDNAWERVNLIAAALMRVGPAADDALLEFVDDPNLGEAGMMIYYTILLRADERILPKLEAMLQADDPQKKEMAFQALAMLREAKMEDVLLKEFARPDAGDDMFYPMLQLLNGTQNPQAAKLLVDFAKPGGRMAKGEQQWMRENAYQALARMEDPVAVDFMLGRLRNNDRQLQSILGNYGGYSPNGNSFYGRGFLNDPRIIPLVLKAMTAPKLMSAAPVKPRHRPARGAKPKPPRVKRWTPPPPPTVNSMLASQGWNILTAITNPGAKKELAAALRDANPRARAIAACALGRFDKAVATPALLPLLADKDLFQRRRAAETLAGFGDYRALPTLSTLLQREKNLDARKKIVTAMAKCGAPAVPVLLKALEGKKSGQSPILGISVPGSPYPGPQAPPSPAYHRMMMNHQENGGYSDGSLCAHLISTLAKMNDPRVTAAFEKMAKDKNVDKAFGALRALVNARHPQIFNMLIDALNHPVEGVRNFAATELAKLGDARAVKPLRKAMKEKDKYDVILGALVELKDPAAIDEALKMFEPKMLNENSNSIILLGESRDPRAYDLLMPLLNRARRERRETMSNNYNGREGMAYRERGMGMVVNDPGQQEEKLDQYTFTTIVTALGKLGDARAVEPLIEALQDELDGGQNRYWSPYDSGENQFLSSYVAALGELADKRAEEPIIDALNAGMCDVRVASVALAKIGDSSAVPAILRAAHAWEMMNSMRGGYGYGAGQPDDQRIPESLGSFHDAASADALKVAVAAGMWRTRLIAVRALAYRNEPWCADALLPLLQDPQPQVRVAAAQSLARLKAVAAREEIIKLRTDRYPEVREAAGEALKEIK